MGSLKWVGPSSMLDMLDMLDTLGVLRCWWREEEDEW